MTTTTTPTSPVIRTKESPLSSDVFYGNINLNVDGKMINVMVSNHIKENKQYEFRVASKCKAGFINISDWKSSPRDIIAGFKKNNLVNAQVKLTYESGREVWMNVFTTKGGKWHSIDKGFLDVLTVGDMRTSHPNMCDSEMWGRLGASTWADMAFVENTK